jgi:hypothetical protein
LLCFVQSRCCSVHPHADGKLSVINAWYTCCIIALKFAIERSGQGCSTVGGHRTGVALLLKVPCSSIIFSRRVIPVSRPQVKPDSSGPVALRMMPFLFNRLSPVIPELSGQVGRAMCISSTTEMPLAANVKAYLSATEHCLSLIYEFLIED